MNWFRSNPTLIVTDTDASGAVVSREELTYEAGALVSSITFTVDPSGAVISTDDSRASLMKDLEATLEPLPAYEAAAVEAAKKSYVEPTAVNGDDISYESVTYLSNDEINLTDKQQSTIDFLTSVNTRDLSGSPRPRIEMWNVSAANESVADLSNNEINFLTKSLRTIFTGKSPTVEFLTSINARDLSGSPMPHMEIWNVSAANSGDTQDGFATFQSTWIDQVVASHTPAVQEKTDSYGRRYFSFDNGINNSFVAIVFEVQGNKMLSLGDLILPLDEFFSLVSCEFKGEARIKKCGELRSGNETGKVQEHVECVFPTRTLTISKLTADMVMTVLTHLSHVYATPAHTHAQSVKNEIVFTKPQTQQPWYFGSLGVAFFAGLVYGGLLVAGRYVNK